MAPPHFRPLRIALLLTVTALGVAFAATAPSRGLRVQLVESVPIETGLGNPALPSARSIWLEMIRGARRTLDFEEFYLSTWPGEPMDEIVDAIGAAARRGVAVRLMLDARMHQTYPHVADSLAGVPGVSVRLIDMGKIAGGVQHAKFFLVDGNEVFLGSQNFDWRALKHIHELGVRVRDPRVATEFGRVFEMDWAVARPVLALTAVDTAVVLPSARGPAANDAEIELELPFRIVNAPKDTVDLWPSYSPRSFIPDSTRWDQDAIVHLLDSASREIVVQLLTYGIEDRGRRDDALDAALRRAARRGVRVKLLVSDWIADRSAVHDLESLAVEPNVEVKLSVVPEWKGGYIPFARVEHCKYVTADSLWLWVGTSNWEPGYFYGSRNIAVTLRNRRLALDARRVFEASWRAPQAIVVRTGAKYAPRVHGETPPPGRRKYGG